MAIDLTASATPRVLFAPEPETLYRIQSFSPDGRRLALYARRGAQVSLAVYGLQSGRLHTFKEIPDRRPYETTLVWASKDEIVYTALPADSFPMLAARRSLGRHLYEVWNESWSGKKPSVTEAASRADGRLESPRSAMLVRADCRTGTTERLTQGYFTDLSASADGRFVSGLRRVEILQPMPDRRVLDDWTRHELVVVDLKNGGSRTVALGMHVSTNSTAWSPTTHDLGFFAWKKDADINSGAFHSYDPHLGKLRTWPHQGLDVALGFSHTRPGRKPERVQWLGERLAIFAREDQQNEESGGGRKEPAHWFLLSLQGRWSKLTAEFNAVSSLPVGVTPTGLYLLVDGKVVSVSPDGETDLLSRTGGLMHANNPMLPQGVALTAKAEGKSSYLMLDFSDGAERSATIVAPSQQARWMDGSARAGVALFREDTDNGSIFYLQRTQGAPIEVGRVNEYLAAFAKPEWRTIGYLVRDGREVRSGMFLPYGYDPAKRYPVVVVVYPGIQSGTPPVSRIGESYGFYAPQLIAAKGYIVLFASTPSDLQRTEQGPIAGMTDLVLAGVDALVAQGYADPERISLFGLSQGGICALWLATQTERFKAVVSINGWADMQTHYLESGLDSTFYADIPRPRGSAYYDLAHGSAFGIGRTPWQDADVYVRNSPVWQAHRINTPILLIHSDMDFGFEIGQYERMFNALYRLRKEARLLRYWGEGHGPSSPANIRDLWTRVFTWFDQWTDVARDAQGNMTFDGARVKSRNARDEAAAVPQ
ncbi:MAG: alpha/beta hydrolase family protein [Gammaproteobacteria bacterium]